MPKRGDPDWEEYRTCTRKRWFGVEPVLGKDYLAGWVRPYSCKFCQGWHLTSKPRSGKKKHEQTARDKARQALTIG